MNRKRPSSKAAALAALVTATCCAFGTGCIQAVFASIGATFF